MRVGYGLALIKREWNNCFIKNTHKTSRILQDFCVKPTDFKLLFNFEQMSYHIWRTWYNGSYTMMAKPIRALEFHYPTIQFLIVANILLLIRQNQFPLIFLVNTMRFIFFIFLYYRYLISFSASSVIQIYVLHLWCNIS